MKVYIAPYVDRWISTIHDRYMRNKYGYNDWPETQTRFENFLEKLEDVLQWIYNHSINLYLDKKQRKVKVKLHKYDTWNMDSTLAYIVHPMLVQLKATKHGVPFVNMEDRPENLQCYKEPEDPNTDKFYFEAWDWAMDEMIWAFEQKCKDDWEDTYYGPYTENPDGSILGGRFEWIDDEGLKKHQERMSNGFRLFGKYYEKLWD